MVKRASLILVLFLVFAVRAQEVSLPADLRQHALTQYNASLFNPTFSLDRNNPQSVSFWTRWQWQQIDADPTTLFLNYTRSLNEKSAVGAGFFQHNTGVYFNTGGVVNYAYSFELNPIIKLSVGANLFGFNQSLADTRFLPDPDALPFPVDITDDFILQLAPGFNLSVENFSFSMASENLFDYNLSDKGSNTENSDKIFMGMASYDFPIIQNDSTAYLRPSIYLRTIPEQQNQIGMNVLFSTRKYWAQTGYNNFYGISIGAGGTVFNRFSLGALLEFGTSASLNNKDSSFEIIASFFLGRPEDRRQEVVNLFDALDEEVALSEEEPEDEKVDEQENLDDEEEVTGEVISEEEVLVDKKEERRLEREEKAIAKERRRDSLAAAKQEQEALAIAEEQRKEQEKLQAEEVNKLEAAAVKAKREQEVAAAEEAKKAQEAAEEERKAEAKARADRMEAQKRQDSINAIKEAEALVQAEKIELQRKADSINEAKKAEALLAAQKLQEQRRQDSIARAEAAKEVVTPQQEEEVVKPQAGEKYEEVQTEDGLEPGYYLIANVFGTKKYFDAFMQDLRNKGLEPGSFLISKNNYNYAYLKRYNTISEARRARDSRFDGKYEGKTWIFRVVGE